MQLSLSILPHSRCMETCCRHILVEVAWVVAVITPMTLWAAIAAEAAVGVNTAAARSTARGESSSNPWGAPRSGSSSVGQTSLRLLICNSGDQTVGHRHVACKTIYCCSWYWKFCFLQIQVSSGWQGKQCIRLLVVTYLLSTIDHEPIRLGTTSVL